MKRLIICLPLLILLQMAIGQDVIITIQHDTIHCRILNISPAHIQYEQRVDGYMVGKFIPTEHVLMYFRNPQSLEPVPYHYVGRQKSKPAHRWQIGAYSGGGSLLASTADDEKSMIDMGVSKSHASDYYKKYKRGWSINGDIYYMFSDIFGMGAKYSMFRSSVEKDLAMRFRFLPTGPTYLGPGYELGTISANPISEYLSVGIKEIQYIHYAGPSVIFRQRIDGNHIFQVTETLSAGYVHYRSETRFDPNQHAIYYSYTYGTAPVPIYNFLLESKTWGVNVGFCVDYFPVSRLSVGIGAGFMYAHLKKVDLYTKDTTETANFEKGNYHSLARLDYSLSVRYYF